MDTDVAPKKRGRPKGAKNKVKPDMRAPMRAEMRADDAFAYTPDDENDRLKLPRELMREGQDYLWVTGSIYGQPQPQRLSRFQKQGWIPVMASQFDGLFMPRGHNGYIEVDGLVLHERSKKISDMARAHEIKKARNQIRAKEAQLLGGQMDGVSLDSQHSSALRTNKINKSYEPIKIPED